ncbi:DMT family transporter [Roseovarius spongiae]|uniref:DMT family transporter n=1 Tax=Roseovarius spongiae TaxID=2320272 RepID=A0A3A8B4W6_9RHOB|nr:DMT family transporter [Roseovarius spongiae]RKF13909.1 DMT family transporter [Roseovarius spongiae]
MTTDTLKRNNLLGALCAFSAMVCVSFNDMAFKFLSGGYALHQIVFLRATIGLVVFAVVVMPLNGGLRVIRTRRPWAHLLRGCFVVCANMALFLGLAAMPLAEAVAITFISPLLIAVMSVIFLNETVGPRRWAAIIVGFAGVLVIVQPGTAAFQAASLLPALAALLYSSMHMVTRRIRATESAPTMSFYTMLSFAVASAAFGLVFGDGRFAGGMHPSLEFLLRAWGPIARGDVAIIVTLGALSVLSSLLVSQTYRLSEAAFAAPFEYVAMPLAIMWGVTVFGTWPAPNAWAGIALILGSGLYMLWRESIRGTPTPPTQRR